MMRTFVTPIRRVATGVLAPPAREQLFEKLEAFADLERAVRRAEAEFLTALARDATVEADRAIRRMLAVGPRR